MVKINHDGSFSDFFDQYIPDIMASSCHIISGNFHFASLLGSKTVIKFQRVNLLSTNDPFEKAELQ